MDGALFKCMWDKNCVGSRYGKNVSWNSSDLRKWLNEDFYDNAFNESEKTFIQTVEKDNITLLTAEEATTLMDVDEREAEEKWWLTERTIMTGDKL